MQPISIRYPNGTEKAFEIPTEFHELNQDQYLGAVAVMNNADQRPELQWALIPMLMKIPLADVQQLNEVQRVELLKELNFLFDPETLPYKAMITSFSTLQYKSTLIPRKVARALSCILYGPGDGLGNLNFGEFMAAEKRLELFNKNPASNSNALNELCGILFRKTNKQQKAYIDKRIRFEEGLIPERGQIFQAVAGDVKAAILLNYRGAKAMFPKLYRNLFPPDLQDDDNENEAPAVNQKSQALTWLNMLTDMAERDVTKYPLIKKASLHETLKSIDETIALNKKMKAEADKLRRK